MLKTVELHGTITSKTELFEVPPAYIDPVTGKFTSPTEKAITVRLGVGLDGYSLDDFGVPIIKGSVYFNVQSTSPLAAFNAGDHITITLDAAPGDPES